MPVYDCEMTAPNGNKVSRPIVAATAEDAMTDMALSHDVEPSDPSFTIVVKERADDGGRLEQMLNDAEARRLEQEFYKRPEPRRRVRR